MTGRGDASWLDAQEQNGPSDLEDLLSEAARYRSPFPTVVAPDFVNRDRLGNATMTKRHIFPVGKPAPDVPRNAASRAVEIKCNPTFCRECWREANWKEGQAHG